MTWQRIVIGITWGLVSCTTAPPRRTSGADQRSSASVTDATPPPVLAAVTRERYALLTPEQTGVQNVFEDAHDTYLQFSGPVPAGLLMFDENGQAVRFCVGARGVVVRGVHAGLLVRTPTRRSYAEAPQKPNVREPSSSLAEEGAALPEDLAAARAQILRAEDRLTEVSAQLDQASQGQSSVSLRQVRADLETIQTSIDGVNATLLRTHFAVGSAVLNLSADARGAVLAMARRADDIQVHGGADASGATAVNEVLAHARALSMRRLLIEGGIGDAKVHVSGTRADYIAPNTTRAGRAQNRRVDVVLANPRGVGVPLANNP